MSEGPFTDDMVKHYVVSMQTRAGIQETAEAIAKVFAEMGRASNKVTGDAPIYALEQWNKLILARAVEILKAEEPTVQQLREKMQKRLAKK